MNKKDVIIISKSEELYRSLKRAINTIANINATQYESKYGNKQAIVIYIIEDVEIDSWLWGEFRKKALNPLIVIGFEDKRSFISKHPLFVDYSEEHAYIQIPFDLIELIKTLIKLKPIYNHAIRRVIVNDYSKAFEHKFITHDTKIIKEDKVQTISNFLQAKDFYSEKAENEIVKIIGKEVGLIKKSDDWQQIAFNLKKYLEARLKDRNIKFNE